MRARRRKRQVDHVTQLVAILLPQLFVTCLLLAPGQAQPTRAAATTGDEMSAPAPMEGQVMNDIAKSWSNMMEGYRRKNDVVLFPDDLVLVMKGHSEDSVVRALNSQEPRQTHDSSPPVHLDGMEVLHFLEHELEQDVIDPSLLAYDGMEIQEFRLHDAEDPASHHRSKRYIRPAQKVGKIQPEEIVDDFRVDGISVHDALNSNKFQVVLPSQDHVGFSSPNEETIDTQKKAEGSATHGATLGRREEPLLVDLFRAKAPVEVIEDSEGTQKPAPSAEPSSRGRNSESSSYSNNKNSPAGFPKQKNVNIKSDEHKEASTTTPETNDSGVKKQDGKYGENQSISKHQNGTSTAQKSAHIPERKPDTNDEIVSSEDPMRSNMTAVENNPIVLNATPTIQDLISGDVKCEEQNRHPLSISVEIEDGLPRKEDKKTETVSPPKEPLNSAKNKSDPRKEKSIASEPHASLKKEDTLKAVNKNQQGDSHPENKNDHSSAMKTSYENVHHESESPSNQSDVLKDTTTVPKKKPTNQTPDKAKKMLNETGALHPNKDNPGGSLNRMSATRSVYQQLSEKQPGSHVRKEITQECGSYETMQPGNVHHDTLIPKEGLAYTHNHQHQPNEMMNLHEGIHQPAHLYSKEQHQHVTSSQPVHAIPARSHQYAQQTLYAPHDNPVLSLEHAHLIENSRPQQPHMTITHPGNMAGTNAYQSDFSSPKSHHDFLQDPDWAASMMERDSSSHNFNWNGPETGSGPSLPDTHYAGEYTLTTQSPFTSGYHPINYGNEETWESTPSTTAPKKGKKKKKKKVWKLPFVPQTTTPAPWPMSLASLAPFISMPEFPDYSSGTPLHRRYQNNFFLPPLPPLWDPNSLSPPTNSFEHMQSQHDFSGFNAPYPYQYQADNRMPPPYLQYPPMPQMQAPWAEENYNGNPRQRRSLRTRPERHFPSGPKQESGDIFPEVMEYQNKHGRNEHLLEARDIPHEEHISKTSTPEDQGDFFPLNIAPRMKPALSGEEMLDSSLRAVQLEAEDQQKKSLGFANSEISPTYLEDVSITHTAARQNKPETHTGFSDEVGVFYTHPSKSDKHSQMNLSPSPKFSPELPSGVLENLRSNPTDSLWQTIPAEQLGISIENPEMYSPLAELSKNQKIILHPDLSEAQSAEQQKMGAVQEESPQKPEVSDSVVTAWQEIPSPDLPRSKLLTVVAGEKRSGSVVAQSAQSSITEQRKKPSDQEVFITHPAAAEPIATKQELVPASDTTHSKPSALLTQETPDIDPTLSGSLKKRQQKLPNEQESPVLQTALPAPSEPVQEQKATLIDKSLSAPVGLASDTSPESEKTIPQPTLTTGQKKISDREESSVYSSLSAPLEPARQQRIPTCSSLLLSEALANGDESKLRDFDEGVPQQKKIIDHGTSTSLSEQLEPEQKNIAAKPDSLPLKQSREALAPLSPEPVEIEHQRKTMDQHMPSPYADASTPEQQQQQQTLQKQSAKDTSLSDFVGRNQELQIAPNKQPAFLPVVNKNNDEPLVMISTLEQNQQQQEKPKSNAVQNKPTSFSSTAGLEQMSSSEHKEFLHSLETSQSPPESQEGSEEKYLAESSKETMEEKFGIASKNNEKGLSLPQEEKTGKKLVTKSISLPKSELIEEKALEKTSIEQTDDLKSAHPAVKAEEIETVQKDKSSSTSETYQQETPINLAGHLDNLSPEQEVDILSSAYRVDRSCAEAGGANACAVQEQKPEPSPQSHPHQDGSGDHMMMAPAFPFRQPMVGIRPYGPPALPPALEELMPRTKETEEERAEREHKAVQRMIQLVNVLGSLQSFVADRAKTIVKRLHRIVEDEESESRCGC